MNYLVFFLAFSFLYINYLVIIVNFIHLTYKICIDDKEIYCSNYSSTYVILKENQYYISHN